MKAGSYGMNSRRVAPVAGSTTRTTGWLVHPTSEPSTSDGSSDRPLASMAALSVVLVSSVSLGGVIVNSVAVPDVAVGEMVACTVNTAVPPLASVIGRSMAPVPLVGPVDPARV